MVYCHRYVWGNSDDRSLFRQWFNLDAQSQNSLLERDLASPHLRQLAND